MAEKNSRAERQAWKQGEEILLGSRAFVKKWLAPLKPGARGAAAEWMFEVVRNKLSSRMTVKYTSGSQCEIYGKAYHDHTLGQETYRVMSYLWDHAFSANLFFRIPEPLSYVGEANLLLIRKAGGAPLSELAVSGRMGEARAAMRLAARWLVKFQRSLIPDLRSESPCETVGVLNVTDAVAKVAAEIPQHSAHLIDMLHQLRSIAPTKNGSPAPVPMHGQFRPAHVFIEGQHATVIDIEKVCLADPAKDVARFCHVLKKACLEEDGDRERTRELIQSFVREYQKYNPRGLENYLYFRALLALKAYAKMLTSQKLDLQRRDSICEGYSGEFKRALDQAAARWAA